MFSLHTTPHTYFPFDFGAKKARLLCAHLIMEKCRKNITIEPNGKFSSRCGYGNNSGIGANCILAGCSLCG